MDIIVRSFLSIALPIAVIAGSASCIGGNGPIATETREYSDSTAHAYLSMHVELPVASKGAPGKIREQLIDILGERLCRITSYENERFFDPFDGDKDDTDGLLGYYRDNALKVIGEHSQKDADERAEYSEGEDYEFPSWDYDFSFKKVIDTDRFVVFLSQDYIYMGGAHGGVTGQGYLTFDKGDGRLVTTMVDPSCTADIQPLLVQGLISYYKEFDEVLSPEELKGHLMIDGDLIPLPSWAPYPDGKGGLVFIYQQYEIASYAEGMPSFTIPLQDMMPFLTDDARKLFQ